MSTAVVFVVQYLFDEAQITADNVGPPVQRQQWRYIHDLGVDIKNTLSNVSLVYDFLFVCLCMCVCVTTDLITVSRLWKQVTSNAAFSTVRENQLHAYAPSLVYNCGLH